MIRTLLTSKQIQERIDEFNESGDWSVFNDVHLDQHFDIMYPHKFDFSILTKKEK